MLPGQLQLTRTRQYFVAWSRLERIFATGHTARLQPISIRARSDVFAGQGSVEVMADQIDLPTLDAEH
jgi:hypothetical protein